MMRALLGASVTAVMVTAAHAAPMNQYVGIDFSRGQSNPSGTYSIGYNNSGDFTFSDISNGLFTTEPVAVMTNGLAAVTATFANSFFGPSRPTPFQDPRGGFQPSTFGDPDPNNPVLYTYTSFSQPATIPYSISRQIIGLRDVVGGEVHYGFAELAGTTLLSYGFETRPNASIVTPVPLPGSAPVFGAGLAALGLAGYAAKRKRAAVA